jgi:hypothetical protein
MAKDKLTEYSATNASNDVIGDISVAEGMLPSAVNNALREQMTHLKNFSDGTDAIDALAVDNLKLDGNTISSTDTNGDITIDPAGTGDTIVASGNVGIGTSSPQQLLHLKSNNPGGKIRLEMGQTGVANGDVTGEIQFYHNDASGAGVNADIKGICTSGVGAGALTFGTGTTSTTERMRIEPSGNLLIGRTITDSNTGGHFITPNYGFFENDGTPFFINRYNSNGDLLIFRKNNSGVGSVSTNGSSTSYNTSSDYRLKENVTATWDATTRLKQLNPVRFNFIADPDIVVDGFIAHEAATVCPESVSGSKDEVDDDGNPVMQGIDQSKIVPLLTKALIESVEKIEALEARITALEAE